MDKNTGTYTVNEPLTHWNFSGTVGGPLNKIVETKGADQIGKFEQVSFDWTAMLPYEGIIRLYSNPATATFTIVSVNGGDGPTPDFPAFTTVPQVLHTLDYRDQNFSPHSFKPQQTSTPWILFDDNKNTVVISPLSDFLVSSMNGDGVTSISSGLMPSIASVPKGFGHSSIMTFGTGIESTVRAWGDSLTLVGGKPRPSDNDDPLLKSFGYWTDHGATYYYNYDQAAGYAGTLLAVKRQFDQDQIPLSYMQLDSWWYQKSYRSLDGAPIGSCNSSLPVGSWNSYGGTMDYSASPALFPAGLAAYQRQLGIPLVVHSRWIDTTSPYHLTYNFSGVAAIDPRWWDDRMHYLAQNGVRCYEQDWLVDIFSHSPQMADDLQTAALFTDNMARAAAANGLTLQYCMPTPRFFLQGSRYSNLTTIRTSDDRFERARWNDFVYTSILADAVRIRPWTDTFMSSELGNLLVATLSTGPVGTGDKIGSESKANIMRVIRDDGVIVKPDAPLLPTDDSILADAKNLHQPLVCSTYTDEGIRTGYVFAFTRPGDSSTVSFTPAALGFSGPVYVCPMGGTAKLQDASAPFADTLGTGGWQYYTIASITRSGIALLGDVSKFVGTGRQIITSVSDKRGKLTVSFTYDGFSQAGVTVAGYSARKPTVDLQGGNADPVVYDPSTGLFTVKLHPPLMFESNWKRDTPMIANDDVTFTTSR